MRWRHKVIEKAGDFRSGLGKVLRSSGEGAYGLLCVEAANALIRVHRASTQNQNQRTKTSKISMSQRDNRKSCHSDQLSSQ